MALPLLESLDIAGKTITADALLTQRKIAEHVVAHGAHYVFIAKDNQPTLAADIRRHFAARGAPDFREPLSLAHGRLESRAIWASTARNDDLDFPHVGQVFVIERQCIDKTTAKTSIEVAYGVTDHSPESTSPARLLACNRDHWGIEVHHDILDWNWDEERCRLRTGHGPENITRLRRFAVGLIKANSDDSVAATIAKLARRVRRVFDSFLMTDKAKPRASRSAAEVG